MTLAENGSPLENYSCRNDLFVQFYTRALLTVRAIKPLEQAVKLLVKGFSCTA